jgi:hypothetical protein
MIHDYLIAMRMPITHSGLEMSGYSYKHNVEKYVKMFGYIQA